MGLCSEMAAAPCPAFAVIDDFLDERTFVEILAKFPDMCPPHGTKQFVQVEVPPTAARQLRDFMMPQANENADVGKLFQLETPVSLRARIETEKKSNHADVTLTGKSVNGCVCVVYLGGSGTFILTDELASQEGERVEHRIEVQPNRVVRWDNARFTHRVEVADTAVPRFMLGPCSVDSSGKLFCTMGGDGCMDGFNSLVLGFCCWSLGALLMCLLVTMLLPVSLIMTARCLRDNDVGACGGWFSACVVLFGGLGGLGCSMFFSSGNWRFSFASFTFSFFRRDRSDYARLEGEMVEVPRRAEVGYIIQKGQDDFCTQCSVVGQEFVMKRVLQRANVEDLDPTLVLGLPAIVTFRFLMRSAVFGDRFVFRDGCVVMDSALPNYHPLVYLFLRRVRKLRQTLGELLLSDGEVNIVEMRLLDTSVGFESLDAERARALNHVVSEVNSMAIDISRLQFYRDRLPEITREIVDTAALAA